MAIIISNKISRTSTTLCTAKKRKTPKSLCKPKLRTQDATEVAVIQPNVDNTTCALSFRPKPASRLSKSSRALPYAENVSFLNVSPFFNWANPPPYVPQSFNNFQRSKKDESVQSCPEGLNEATNLDQNTRPKVSAVSTTPALPSQL